MQKLLDSTYSIKVQFNQRVSYPWQAKPDSSRGTFFAVRDGKFRVEYEQPTKINIISDGQRLLVYYPSENTYALEKLDPSKGGLFYALMFFSKPIRELLEPVSEIENANITTIVLKPRDKDPVISRVSIEMQGGDIKSLKIEERSGILTTIEFLAIKRNFRPSEDLFRVMVPESAKPLLR
ncbi:MAG: outer membrane lipoprotein carrier protein LolA [Aquificaceae bacterium]|nr:outer membrane lipoprotein carrier protein LolA [Aquificaceae bacterium]